MHDVLILAAKGLVGGVLVVAFALLSQGLAPKRFAGLFGAAPAVAIAGLSILLLDTGSSVTRESARGMVAGSIGMVAYAAAVVPILRRGRAGRSAAVAMIAWVTATAAIAIPLVGT
jgi:hypothetical protein